MLKTVVLLAAFMVNFLGGSLGYSAGIIHLGLLKKFPEFSSEVAWAGSLFTSVFCLAGPISSVVINTLSCRSALFIGSLLNFAGFLISSLSPRIEFVLLCYGIMAGIGQSLVYSASVVVVSYYFHENPSAATGVLVSGTGVGVTVFPIVTEFLLTTYGIDGAFLLLSAYGLFPMAGSFSDVLVWISRIVTGLAASDPNIDGKILYMGSYFILALCTSLLPLTGASFTGKILYSIVLGLYSSGVWSLLTTVSVEIVGLEQMSTAFGIEMLTSGVGFLFGPIIGDTVKTQSGGYTFVFVTSGIFYMMAAVFEALMILTMKKTDVHQTKEMEMKSIETDVMIDNSEKGAINDDSESDDDHRKNIELEDH